MLKVDENFKLQGKFTFLFWETILTMEQEIVTSEFQILPSLVFCPWKI